jgi:hypothetical protein
MLAVTMSGVPAVGVVVAGVTTVVVAVLATVMLTEGDVELWKLASPL